MFDQSIDPTNWKRAAVVVAKDRSGIRIEVKVGRNFDLMVVVGGATGIGAGRKKLVESLEESWRVAGAG